MPIFLLYWYSNKCDLLKENDPILLLSRRNRQLGYDFILTQSNGNLDELIQRIDNQTVAFVGQSGVGKSTLINAIIPDADQKTNVSSENSALGQHTTTSTRLIRFGENRCFNRFSQVFVNLALWHLDHRENRWWLS